MFLFFPGSISEYSASEPRWLVTCLRCQTAGGFDTVKVVGQIVEIVRITVLLMTCQIDGIVRILIEFGKLLFAEPYLREVTRKDYIFAPT